MINNYFYGCFDCGTEYEYQYDGFCRCQSCKSTNLGNIKYSEEYLQRRERIIKDLLMAARKLEW